MTLRAGPGTPLAANFREYAATATPWTGRDGAVLSSFGGAIIQTGGWNSLSPFDGHKTTNEIWKYDGAWSLLLANDYATTTRPPPMHTAPTFVHNGKLFVLGSDIFNGPQNDVGTGAGTATVWMATSPTSWTLKTSSAAFGPCVLHVGASYAGKMWCGLGQTGNTPGTARKSWFGSSDDGATWQQYQDFPGAARGMIYDPFEWNGELWIIGGGTYDEDPGNRTYYNGIYAWNGSTWRTVVADGASPIEAREYHRTLVFGGAMCVINGYGAGGNIASFQWSDNGTDWATRPFLWSASHGDGICVHNGSLYMGPGNHGGQSLWRVEMF